MRERAPTETFWWSSCEGGPTPPVWLDGTLREGGPSWVVLLGGGYAMSRPSTPLPPTHTHPGERRPPAPANFLSSSVQFSSVQFRRSSDTAPTSARRARASGAPTRSSHTRRGSASLTRVFSSSAEGVALLRALRRPSSVEVDLNSLGQVVLTHATLCPGGKSVSYVCKVDLFLD